jgi:hypothetical protein
MSDSCIFAGSFGSGVFISTNNGTSWAAVDSGLSNKNVYSLALGGSNIFAGTFGAGVFLSSNNGTSWAAVNSGLANDTILSLAVSGNNVFAGTFDGIYLSTNSGRSWTKANSGVKGSYVQAFEVSGGNIFAATDSGVFLSGNNGTSWKAVNYGFTDSNSVRSFAVSNGTLFAGTQSFGVWSRPLSQMSVLPSASPRVVLPESNFKVFTPSLASGNATIEFSLPHPDHISLSVYNLAGHEIASLINQTLSSGRHSISWNTRNLAAGCYSVRLKAGSNTFVRSVPIVR